MRRTASLARRCVALACSRSSLAAEDAGVTKLAPAAFRLNEASFGVAFASSGARARSGTEATSSSRCIASQAQWCRRISGTASAWIEARDAEALCDADETSNKPPKRRVQAKSNRRAKSATGPSAEIKKLMDMRDPASWYPLARSMRREITLHIGPTNSGKTYSAMQRLKGAGSGVYCAPLRLLAWEISESMNKDGVPCTLITGQEHKEAPNAMHTSCTVEMSDLSRVMDCAVIDEVQLLSDPHRGYAYTRALLGLPALELHLCGDPRVVPLVKKIVQSTGDLLVVKEYERLSPLEVSDDVVNNVKKVRKGDAFVAFSRTAVYRLKRDLETRSALKACVIYGGLPPETRSRQAQLFNTPDSGYDVLIASDAIGMGLNLNIKRVVFTTMTKFDGNNLRALEPPETRQIAGRAGRYGLNYADAGTVTTSKKAEFPLLAAALEGNLKPLEHAGLSPSIEQVEEYCALRPGAGLVDALQALTNSAKLASHFRMRNMEESIAIAQLLAKLPLTLEDHFLFSIAPVDVRDAMVASAVVKFARTFCTHGRVGVRLIALPPARTPTGPDELQKLESAHKCLDLYLWLARRLPQAFPEEELASAYRSATATAISAGLQYLSTISHRRRNKSPRSGAGGSGALDVLSSDAVRDAFNAVEKATKDTEDERESAGLTRITDAERKAATTFRWIFGRGRSSGPKSATVKKDEKLVPKSKKTSASVASSSKKKTSSDSPPTTDRRTTSKTVRTKKLASDATRSSHLRPSWLNENI